MKKRNCFAKYGEKAREVIDALLEQYAESGVTDIESLSVLDLSVFSKFGKMLSIISSNILSAPFSCLLGLVQFMCSST